MEYKVKYMFHNMINEGHIGTFFLLTFLDGRSRYSDVFFINKTITTININR